MTERFCRRTGAALAPDATAEHAVEQPRQAFAEKFPPAPLAMANQSNYIALTMMTDLPALADHFALLLETLLKLIFRFGAPTGEGAEFCRRLHWRLRRLGNRFASLVARVQAGTLRPPRVRPIAADTDPRQRLPRAPDPFPRKFAWLHRLLLPHAPPFTGQLESLVWNEPSMAALVAAAPQAGRVLRPLCHMLAVQLPDYLKLPKRKRVRKVHPSPRPSPTKGEGESRRRVVRERDPPAPVQVPPVAPAGDGGATDAQAMRERVAAWLVGRPEPPYSPLLPLGLPASAYPRNAEVPPQTFWSRKNRD
jgi:hypothetical protein